MAQMNKPRAINSKKIIHHLDSHKDSEGYRGEPEDLSKFPRSDSNYEHDDDFL